jgi:hypothetical protein
MAGLDDAIDAARNPKKATTSSAPTGDSVTKSDSNPVLGGPVQRPGATQTALQQQIASNPYPTVDPNASVGEHLLAAGRQVGRGVSNVGRVFADEFTHGSYDKRLAPSGPDAARVSTQQAGEELGTGGNLGIRTMANIANPTKYISKGYGLARSGLEGAITGGWDAYEHGGNMTDTLWGAGTGAAVNSGLSAAGRGIYQGVRKYAPKVIETVQTGVPKVGQWIADATGLNKVAPSVPTPGTVSSVTAATKKAANDAFQQLDQNQYHSPHLLNAASQIDTSVLNDPIVRTASPGTHRVLTDFQKDLNTNITRGDPTGAGSVHTQIKKLDKIITQGGPDGASASAAKSQLEGLFANLPPTNNSAANVLEAFNKAKASHGMFKNAEMLGDMENDLGVFGKMPGVKAQAELNPKTGNPNYYKGPGQTEAMTNIGQSGKEAPSLSPWSLSGTGIGAGGGGYFGHPLLGGTAGAIADASRIVDSPAAARQAIYDAYPALTGKAPVNPETAFAEALKRPGMGILSSGEGKPNPITAVPGSLAPFLFPYMMGQ